MSGHTPGPWLVSPYSGGEGYQANYYVTRQVGARTEWLQSKSGKARGFKTVYTARREIDRITAKAEGKS